MRFALHVLGVEVLAFGTWPDEEPEAEAVIAMCPFEGLAPSESELDDEDVEDRDE